MFYPNRLREVLKRARTRMEVSLTLPCLFFNLNFPRKRSFSGPLIGTIAFL